MNKLILEENDILDFDSNIEEVNTAADTAAVTSSITELIKKVWDLIDSLSEGSVNLSATGDSDITGIISDIVKDEYVHIGQLEKVLDSLVPEAEAIEDGELHTKLTLEEPLDIEEPEEVIPDDVEEEE